jgi:hypothetical protein
MRYEEIHGVGAVEMYELYRMALRTQGSTGGERRYRSFPVL